MSNGSADSVHRVATGRSQSTRFSSRIEVIISRFNYVTYDRLGSNLPTEGFLALIGRLLNGSGGAFRYVEDEAALLNLYKEDRLADIPARLRPLTSEAVGRWIYIYCQPRETIWEVDYRGIINWDATEYRRDGNSDFQPERSESSSTVLFSLLRGDLPDCFGIALPCQIDMRTADMIFSGSYRALTDFLNFSKLRLINRLNDEGPGEGRLIVFDPCQITEQAADAIGVYSRLMSLVDARIPVSRLSAQERRLRNQGILACLCKQLADQDSSVEDDFDMGRLNPAFTRYADYGLRRAQLIDNLYNFMTRPMIEGLEKQFMIYQDGDERPDGRAWLEIIQPVMAIAGDHPLLVDYLIDAAGASTGESAWSAFFKASLERGTHQDSLMVSAWKAAFSQVDAAEMLSSAFTVGSYELLFHYVGRPAGFAGYADELKGLRDVISRDIRAMGRADFVDRNLAKVASIYRTANALGELKAIMEGDVDASRIASVFDSLANAAALRNASGLAMKAMVVKNIFDVYASGSAAADRLRMEDYDAAFGHALVIGAGLAELGLIGYAVATGGSVGGPVGALVGLISAAGAVIVIAATDSDVEYFASHCMWGTTPGEGSARPAWGVGNCDSWRADDVGLRMQLDSLINCLHRYTVRHTFDTVTRVVAIKISTNFLPDTAKFVICGQFQNAAGRSYRTRFTLQFPSRDLDRYRDFHVPGIGGRAINAANYRVQRDGSGHEIEINLKMISGITTGEGWITCQPFGHSEFTVPHENQAFHLEQLIEHDAIVINRYRDYAFESDEWSDMPSWG